MNTYSLRQAIRNSGEYIAKAFAFLLQTVALFKLAGLSVASAFAFVYITSFSVTLIGLVSILYRVETSLVKHPRTESFVIDATICSNILLLFIDFSINDNIRLSNIASLIVILIFKNT